MYAKRKKEKMIRVSVYAVCLLIATSNIPLAKVHSQFVDQTSFKANIGAAFVFPSTVTQSVYSIDANLAKLLDIQGKVKTEATVIYSVYDPHATVIMSDQLNGSRREIESIRQQSQDLVNTLSEMVIKAKGLDPKNKDYGFLYAGFETAQARLEEILKISSNILNAPPPSVTVSVYGPPPPSVTVSVYGPTIVNPSQSIKEPTSTISPTPPYISPPTSQPTPSPTPSNPSTQKPKSTENMPVEPLILDRPVDTSTHSNSSTVTSSVFGKLKN
ncbi:hypothetical protein [Paenibacillus sp. yr247]|uniref:hypothetical protein n=1 Tax=Paenibacillus sp. yr247 TaxID=1761880 RepID=UPI000B804C45|nr:hypothetical protein [Paenibacillus sp. yr247]